MSDSLILHGYYRSSCSARLRIALDLKQIPYTPRYINIKDGHHLTSTHAALNPSLTVPVLEVRTETSPLLITQSVAALEYLDEHYPSTPSLLPSPEDPNARVKVRVLVNIIACDIQPVTNMKVLKSLGPNVEMNVWAREFMAAGFTAYEAVARRTAGKFSCGNRVTMADVCLAPAVWNAQRYGVDMEAFPTVGRIYAELEGHESFKRAHWQKQPDCPEELR